MCGDVNCDKVCSVLKEASKMFAGDLSVAWCDTVCGQASVDCIRMSIFRVHSQSFEHLVWADLLCDWVCVPLDDDNLRSLQFSDYFDKMTSAHTLFSHYTNHNDVSHTSLTSPTSSLSIQQLLSEVEGLMLGPTEIDIVQCLISQHLNNHCVVAHLTLSTQLRLYWVTQHVHHGRIVAMLPVQIIPGTGFECILECIKLLNVSTQTSTQMSNSVHKCINNNINNNNNIQVYQVSHQTICNLVSPADDSTTINSIPSSVLLKTRIGSKTFTGFLQKLQLQALSLAQINTSWHNYQVQLFQRQRLA